MMETVTKQTKQQQTERERVVCQLSTPLLLLLFLLVLVLLLDRRYTEFSLQDECSCLLQFLPAAIEFSV